MPRNGLLTGLGHILVIPLIDPLGPTSGTERVIRGGSLENKREHQTASNRGGNTPEWKRYSVGFRIAYKPIPNFQPNHFADMNNSVTLEMIWVEPGTFTMGSPTTEASRGSDETEHNVTLTKGFLLRQIRGHAGPIRGGDDR